MLKDDHLKFINELSVMTNKNKLNNDIYNKNEVKKGLRNSNGTGVLVGLTEIGDVQGYKIDSGEKISIDGKLTYRGIDIYDLVYGFTEEHRHGFEEISYLLLFGELPNAENLEKFNGILGLYRNPPDAFIQDMILKAPSFDIMNKLARSVLACYSYDNNPCDNGINNLIRQSIELIARFPTIVAYCFQAYNHYLKDESLYIHKPNPELSTAENFLMMIRKDGEYTKAEADLLDLSLVLHAEHGGGNNSSFTVRVVSSTGTDTYSAIAAAIGSLKGPKHGGANIKVLEMMDDLKEKVADWEDQDEIARYLEKILLRKAFDRSGLIYGLGHAIYTLSDPRAVLLKEKALALAVGKNRVKEFNLYALIENLAPKVFARVRNTDKPLCVNVDFYSGFVYDMLNIPHELCTPLFAISRIAGWCAHRIEELQSVNTIIRPAYKYISKGGEYVKLDQR